MSNATFTAPDLTSLCRLDELGLEVTGQQVTAQRSVLECRVVADDDWCHQCGCQGRPRDTVTRELAHEPLGWRPTVLRVRLRRYRCQGCGLVWRQDMSTLIRAEADELRNLPVTNAARRIEAKRAEQEQTWQQAAQRARQLDDPFQHEPRRSDPGRERPSRGL